MGWDYRAVARRLGVPHIVSFYGFDYEKLPYSNPEWRSRYDQLFRDVDLFVCEGAHGAMTLRQMGCSPEKLAVVRLGVDVRLISPCWRKKDPEELRLVQIASLVEKKGHVYTVRAFVNALALCPNMTLTIVGSDNSGGKISDQLRSIVRGTLAEGRVEWLSQVEFSTLHRFLENFHVFIHPSCYAADKDCEGGAPIVILDAQATGMPIISTLHCDIVDEVCHNQTGLLVEEKDVDGLSRCIERFYWMGQVEYTRFAVAARIHIEQSYDISFNAQHLRTLYMSVVAKKRAQRRDLYTSPINS